jgi:L,D-peptidoglycan transpeptidase YkuD (ErfK/YbiS/YcfS/YnhG family)
MERDRRRSEARKRGLRRLIIAAVGGLLIFAVAVVVVGRVSSSHRPSSVGSETQAEAASPSATPVHPPTTVATPAATVSTASPSAASNASVERRTAPERMARLVPGSRQIIVITGAKIGSKSGRLKVYDESDGRWVKVMSVPASFGANGLVDGVARTAGHLQTPTGIWRIGSFLFGQHAAAPPGTRMAYRPIKQNTWWSAQADSTYNTWVTSETPVSGEHLADATVQYEYAFNTGYNSLPNQRVVGRGTAIFIHCAEPPGNSLGQYTHGCIAIEPSAIRRLFATLDPKLHPTCAIGTLQKGSSTSIWAY